MIWLVILGASVLAGVIQTVTGFGGGVLMMMIFPYFFDMLTAPALSSSICLGLTVTLAYKFRDRINWKIIIAPAVFYITISIVVINMAENFDLRILSIVFGAFLVLLALYFMLLSGKAAIKNTPLITGVFSTISGVCSGLFGIGGPMMALYFLALSPDQGYYLGNLQFFFSLTGLSALITRLATGIYTVKMIPLTALGFLGIDMGRRLGLLLSKKLNADVIRKSVYVCVIGSGIITIVTHL